MRQIGLVFSYAVLALELIFPFVWHFAKSGPFRHLLLQALCVRDFRDRPGDGLSRLRLRIGAGAVPQRVAANSKALRCDRYSVLELDVAADWIRSEAAG